MQGSFGVDHGPPRHRLVEPEAPDLLPGELAGRLLSLLKPQDVIEANSAMRPDRRVGQLPTVAEVHDVLAGRTRD